jgi:hypothetical protein
MGVNCILAPQFDRRWVKISNDGVFFEQALKQACRSECAKRSYGLGGVEEVEDAGGGTSGGPSMTQRKPMVT